MLLIGKSGTGKTGALASLVAAGYKLRIIDTDNGSKTLSSLLLDKRYPYRVYCEKKGIDITSTDTVSIKPISQEMQLRSVTRTMNHKSTTETVLGPKNGNAWLNIIKQLEAWKDGEANYGHIETWDDKTVLVFDTFGTLAKIAYYHIQALNGRLGARDEGFDYQRDIGGAQSLLMRLLEWLSSASVSCNAIVSSHITWVDDTRGYAQSPEQLARAQQADRNAPTPQPDGYPAAIGRALSPVMGKYFNDCFTTWQTGSGTTTKRGISTVPTQGVICKNSSYLAGSYDITTALAEIFAAMRQENLPADFLPALSKPTSIPSRSGVTAITPAPASAA